MCIRDSHKEFHFDVQPLVDMGWKPKYSNDAMFKESYEWFLENFDRMKIEKEASAHRKPVKEALLKVLKWFS